VDYTIGELTKYDNTGHSTMYSLSSSAPPLPPPTLGSIDIAALDGYAVNQTIMGFL
jgi:hypothetical protein